MVWNMKKSKSHRKVDGHLHLSDSVHGGADKGGLERDLLGDLGVEGDHTGGEVDVAREQEKVVVGEPLTAVHQLINGETISLEVDLRQQTPAAHTQEHEKNKGERGGNR